MAAVYAVAAEGATLLGLTRQLIEDYAYRGSIGPTQPSAKVNDQLSRIGEALSCDLTLRGLVGVDLVLSDQSVTAIEINPRYTASVEVLERASRASAIAAHAACFASPSPPKWAAPDAAVNGKRIVFASITIEVDRRLSDELMTLQRKSQLADKPRAGTVINAGEPLCTVLAEGASLEEAERLLDAVAERLIARCL
jgi:predicted ATP-grasp superfamily ATP-dependent carboligase